MKYPIGIQNFEQIITEGFVYVDKTSLVHQLVTNGQIYFLSRPRRFGKSLLISTLKNYFLGKKTLFKDLAIAKLEEKWLTYPVFHIDFNGGNFTQSEGLTDMLENYLCQWEQQFGRSPYSQAIGNRFIYVLQQAHLQTGQRAVILIDEYDKPILDVLKSDITATYDGREVLLEEKHREILKAFYSVFKAANEHLKFVLLTGVTKFSQVSIFSGFNQPADISLDARYESLCGITKEEVEQYFQDPIQEMAQKYGIDSGTIKKMLKEQYDGYHFSENLTDIFNPFSLLNALATKRIDDYWFRTGTPTYLVRLLENTKENLNELTGRYYDSSEFIDYKADIEKPLPMFYQSGYLTIKSYNFEQNTFLLDFPNKEVKYYLKKSK
ncbi:MAG: AAA family ATPase [Bacteroides sp.]